MMRANILKNIAAFLLLLIALSCEKDLNTETETATLKLISPSAGTEWKAGAEYLIKWENGTGKPVTIELTEKDIAILEIGTFSHIMTEYNFRVPDSLTVPLNYNLKLYSATEHEIKPVVSGIRILPKDNQPPTCVIIDPKDGKYIMSGDRVEVSVEAIDTDGDITNVLFYINGEFAGTVPKDTFYYTWETYGLPIGVHSITAVAVDNDGDKSDPVKVNVVISNESAPVELIAVPAGKFYFGNVSGDYDEKPQNLTYMTIPYYIGKYEITNSQYSDMLNYAMSQNELTGDYIRNVTVKNLNGTSNELVNLDDRECEIYFDGTQFKPRAGKEKRPAIELTWWGAAFYCNMISRQLNLNELYDLTEWKCNFDLTGYRLPTEAEWEYAAKYNDKRKYPWGSQDPDNTKCNFNSNVKRTTDVGSYSPSGDSALGICDMAGNAWEWCNDWYGYYPIPYDYLINPTGCISGSDKVLRGGNVISTAYYIRTTYRNCYPMGSGYYYGMRIVLSVR
jgi:formylglycine-generating enzyme required for sulfatase activity